jgi:hypothetical protein
VPRSNCTSFVAGRHCQLAVGIASRLSRSSPSSLCPLYPLASQNEVCHPCNCCVSGFWVSAFDFRLLKRHLGHQLIMKNSIVNTRSFHTEHSGRH